jgi:hypothetical protein
MGESLPELHSTIISRNVTAKHAAAERVWHGMKATAECQLKASLTMQHSTKMSRAAATAILSG